MYNLSGAPENFQCRLKAKLHYSTTCVRRYKTNHGVLDLFGKFSLCNFGSFLLNVPHIMQSQVRYRYKVQYTSGSGLLGGGNDSALGMIFFRRIWMTNTCTSTLPTPSIYLDVVGRGSYWQQTWRGQALRDWWIVRRCLPLRLSEGNLCPLEFQKLVWKFLRFLHENWKHKIWIR